MIKKGADFGGLQTITLPEIVAYRATVEVDIFIDFFLEVFLQLQRRANLPLNTSLACGSKASE